MLAGRAGLQESNKRKQVRVIVNSIVRLRSVGVQGPEDASNMPSH